MSSDNETMAVDVTKGDAREGLYALCYDPGYVVKVSKESSNPDRFVHFHTPRFNVSRGVWDSKIGLKGTGERVHDEFGDPLAHAIAHLSTFHSNASDQLADAPQGSIFFSSWVKSAKLSGLSRDFDFHLCKAEDVSTQGSFESYNCVIGTKGEDSIVIRPGLVIHAESQLAVPHFTITGYTGTEENQKTIQSQLDKFAESLSESSKVFIRSDKEIVFTALNTITDKLHRQMLSSSNPANPLTGGDRSTAPPTV